MIYQPEMLAAACDDQDAAMRRLQDADPFLRARAERHAMIEAEIAAIEAGELDGRSRSQLVLMKKIRDGLLAEIVDMIEGARAPADDGIASIWRVDTAARPQSQRPLARKTALRGNWAWSTPQR